MSRIVRALLIGAAMLILPTVLASAPASARRTAAGATINVKTDAGAKGDGVTDDSQAFKSAINTLSATGGTLVVPSGAYLINPGALVSIPSNVTVQGDDATLKAGAYGFALLGIGGSNITINGITVDGDNKVVRGIEIGSGSTVVTISHSIIENIKQPADSLSPEYLGVAAGIRIEGNGDRITIESTRVTNVAAVNYDASLGSPTPVARGIWITPASNEATSTDITIKNDSISEVSPKDDGDCIVIQGNPSDANTQTNLRLIDNVFNHCAKRAIKIQLPGVTVSNNLIINPFLGDNAYVSPIPPTVFDMYSAISIYASDVTVSQNISGGVGSFYNGIEIGAESALNQITIRGNVVEMGPQANISAPSSSVRVFVPVDALTIEHNVLDRATFGIKLDAVVTHATIANNQTHHIEYPFECVSGC